MRVAGDKVDPEQWDWFRGVSQERGTARVLGSHSEGGLQRYRTKARGAFSKVAWVGHKIKK